MSTIPHRQPRAADRTRPVAEGKIRIAMRPRPSHRAVRVVAGVVATALALTAFALPPVPDTVMVPAGAFVRGSNRAEREAAYRLDEAAYGHRVTREQRWYENEPERASADTAEFAITRTPVTNAQYAAFVNATGHRLPDVDAATWATYGLTHPYSSTRRFAWHHAADGLTAVPPAGRADHPVVLVSHADAEAYAAWLTRITGTPWRLPVESEWEKAARGSDGRRYPWGDAFDAQRLNSHDRGPFDTMPVGSFPAGASPHGALDMAGQVFEWTATPGGAGRHIVKGGSWDDKGCGVCRAAARHARPDSLKHILIGFRVIAAP